MRKLWLLTAILAGLVMAVYIAGALLPVGHEASRTVQLNTPPEAVYAVVSDVSGHPRWWAEVAQVEMLPAEAGRVRFREHMSTGPVVLEVVETVPPARFVTAIADPDQPFGGTWTFEIAASNGGSRLTLTERGEVYNPIFRFLSRFVFGHTGTIDSYVDALARHLSP
ncbi:MAG: SRPBCC family protein [Acidobacteriota bacterium]